MDSRVCSGCLQEKAPSAFSTSQHHASRCLACKSAASSRDYYKHREKRLAVHKLWEQHNPEKAKDSRRKSHEREDPAKKREWRSQWGKANRDKVKLSSFKSNLKRKYGLTLEQYTGLLEQQGGVCAIGTCQSTGPFVVDHDHITGMVRGLVCRKCNSGIGFLGDQLENVEAVIAYLRREL